MTRQPPLGATLRVHVDCYAGHRGEQTPRRLRLGGEAVEVAEVLDAWLAPDHRYFKLQSAAGDTYVVRHDVAGDLWELTLFEAPGPASVSPARGPRRSG